MGYALICFVRFVRFAGAYVSNRRDYWMQVLTANSIGSLC